MTRSSERADRVVAALGGIAAVLGVLSLFVLDWYRDTGAVAGGGSGTTFGDLHRVLDNAKGGNGFSFGISPQYFGWLANGWRATGWRCCRSSCKSSCRVRSASRIRRSS